VDFLFLLVSLSLKVIVASDSKTAMLEFTRGVQGVFSMDLMSGWRTLSFGQIRLKIAGLPCLQRLSHAWLGPIPIH
jgi:hypothetical protein